jgi:hypothetical protein
MKISVAFVVCLMLFFGFAPPATCAERKFPYADSVPFLGIEEAIKELKRAVCAVQYPGEPTKDGTGTRVLLGSGFLIEAERNELLAVTCKHIALKMGPHLKDSIF